MLDQLMPLTTEYHDDKQPFELRKEACCMRKERGAAAATFGMWAVIFGPSPPATTRHHHMHFINNMTILDSSIRQPCM
jgi:hypothetical protein